MLFPTIACRLTNTCWAACYGGRGNWDAWEEQIFALTLLQVPCLWMGRPVLDLQLAQVQGATGVILPCSRDDSIRCKLLGLSAPLLPPTRPPHYAHPASLLRSADLATAACKVSAAACAFLEGCSWQCKACCAARMLILLELALHRAAGELVSADASAK